MKDHRGHNPARTGADLLHDPRRQKGTAFTKEERDALGLRGLLPPAVSSQDQQIVRVLENLRRRPEELPRYIYLAALQDRSETLFYRVVMENLEVMMPVIYTPTVGKACQEYGLIYQRPHGLFISAEVSEVDLQLGRIYPALSMVREVSASIAVAVAEVAYDRSLARVPRPDDLHGFITSQMYDARYQPIA